MNTRLPLSLTALSLLAVVGITGCSQSTVTQVTAFDGALHLDLIAPPTRVEKKPDKIAWHLDDEGLVVTVQRIPAEWNGPRRTLASVAAALADRYALGEVKGELSYTPQHIDRGLAAMALTGWITRQGSQNVRRPQRGILINGPRYFYLAEVIAAAPKALSLGGQERRLAASLTIDD